MKRPTLEQLPPSPSACPFPACSERAACDAERPCAVREHLGRASVVQVYGDH